MIITDIGAANGGVPTLKQVPQICNSLVANQLEALADLLEMQDAPASRVHAYRVAAQTLRELHPPVAELLTQRGLLGLQEIPAINRSLARSIEQVVDTGKINLYEHLRHGANPERMLAAVAGIGPALATRIQDQLNIETLAELESAAHDGRLASVSGDIPSAA